MAKQDKKATWMLAVQGEVASLGGHPGQIDWSTAQYLFSVGKSAKEAGESLFRIQVKTAKDPVQVIMEKLAGY